MTDNNPRCAHLFPSQGFSIATAGLSQFEGIQVSILPYLLQGWTIKSMLYYDFVVLNSRCAGLEGASGTFSPSLD